MTTDQTELYQFSEFLSGKLANGGAELSPEQCLEMWRLENPSTAGRDASVHSIQLAIDEMESSRGFVDGNELHSKLRSRYSPAESE